MTQNQRSRPPQLRRGNGKEFSLRYRLTRRVYKVPSTRCWEWLGVTSRGGYGILRVRGIKRQAHRLMWELAHGPIPKSMMIMHRCDNPPCINPRHLKIGSNVDNVADSTRKKRRWKPLGELNGNTKLTWKKVSDIRSVIPKLAKRYRISEKLVHHILAYKCWHKTPRAYAKA